MGQSTPIERNCPKCGAPMTFALPASGKGHRSWQCLDCERPDPLKSGRAQGWLKGELGHHGKRSKLLD
jgi:hypothetical protein